MIRNRNSNSVIKNEPLKNAIKKVIEDNSQKNQNDLVDKMIEAYFYTMIKFDSPDSTAEHISSATVLRKVDGQNKSFLPVFTDQDEMKKSKTDAGFEEVILDFKELTDIIYSNGSDFSGFIINPDSDEIIIDDELLKYILEKKLNPNADHKVVLRKDDSLEVVELSDDVYPSEMIEALKKYFLINSKIDKAYITFIRQENSQSYLLVTDFDGERDEIFAEISKIAKPFLYNTYLDQLQYDTKFGKEVTKGLKPFYRRKILGIF